MMAGTLAGISLLTASVVKAEDAAPAAATTTVAASEPTVAIDAIQGTPATVVIVQSEPVITVSGGEGLAKLTSEQITGIEKQLGDKLGSAINLKALLGDPKNPSGKTTPDQLAEMGKMMSNLQAKAKAGDPDVTTTTVIVEHTDGQPIDLKATMQKVMQDTAATQLSKSLKADGVTDEKTVAKIQAVMAQALLDASRKVQTPDPKVEDK